MFVPSILKALPCLIRKSFSFVTATSSFFAFHFPFLPIIPLFFVYFLLFLLFSSVSFFFFPSFLPFWKASQFVLKSSFPPGAGGQGIQPYDKAKKNHIHWHSLTLNKSWDNWIRNWSSTPNIYSTSSVLYI